MCLLFFNVFCIYYFICCLRTHSWYALPNLYFKFRNLIEVRVLPSKIICVICLIESPLKMMKKAFYLNLKALFVLKIFKFLSQLFHHVGETAWLERSGWLQHSWRHNLVYKQLWYTYCPTSHKVNVTKQWNLVN